jgi:hypothetical protein
MVFARSFLQVFVLTMFLTITVRAAGASGEASYRVLVLLPDTNCGNPCWKGIHPSQTSQAQAELIFKQLPDALELGEGLWTYVPESGYVNMVAYFEMLTLTADRVRIGEVMVHIGAPAYQTRQLVVRISTKETQELVRMFYPDLHLILVTAVPLDGRLSPELPVAAINLVASRPLRQPDAHDWHGFTWLHRYQFGS